MFQRTAVSLFALSLAVPSLAHAATEVVEVSEVMTDTVIVIGKAEGYRALETTSGTKITTPIIDVPQSITVITDKQLKDQAIRSVNDLVRLIPGVSAGQGEGHRDQITLRGNNSTADFFVDGLRDDVQYYRSFYNVARVESHKGPNAMVFGRGGGGGIINRISKGALTDERFFEVTGSLDSFGGAAIETDSNTDLGPVVLRFNAFYEGLENHRDQFDGERYGINPVLGAQFGEKLKVEVGYELANDERVIDRGVPSAFTGTLANPAGPVRGFEEAFFGDVDVNETTFEANILRFKSTYDFSDNLRFTTNALYGDYDKLYVNVFPASAVGGTAAAPTVAVEAYADALQRTTFIAQGNLEWRVKTGSIGHVILAGAEYTQQNTGNERINGFFDPTNPNAASRRRVVPFTTPFSTPPVTFIPGSSGNSNRAVVSELSQASFYLQDQISLGEHFQIIAGLRYDSFDLSTVNRFTNATVSRTDDLWSPRVGLVYKPIETASLYVSWSKSFLPQSGDQFVALDATSSNLAPEEFDNVEIGAKWDIQPGLTLTGAIYRLDRTNTRATGPTPGSVVLTGEQRTEGFELGLTGQVTDAWQASFGYAYTDAVITATTSAAPAGRKVAQVPEHQLSLWNRYDFTDRFGVGLGVTYQDEQFATISNATVLPSFTRVDAAAYLAVSDAVSVQLNVENLFDETYFPNAHNDNNVTPGAPRNARLTVTARF